MAAGAVTYIFPVAGATAPTAAQMAHYSTVIADVVYAAGDTVATVTHNMNVANATGALGVPEITLTPLAVGSAAVVAFAAFSTVNAITVDKNSTSANTGLTVRVQIKRPHTPR